MTGHSRVVTPEKLTALDNRDALEPAIKAE